MTDYDDVDDSYRGVPNLVLASDLAELRRNGMQSFRRAYRVFELYNFDRLVDPMSLDELRRAGYIFEVEIKPLGPNVFDSRIRKVLFKLDDLIRGCCRLRRQERSRAHMLEAAAQ